MDDYSPAKNLMTMCFTYYHTGEMCTCLEPQMRDLFSPLFMASSQFPNINGEGSTVRVVPFCGCSITTESV